MRLSRSRRGMVLVLACASAAVLVGIRWWGAPDPAWACGSRDVSSQCVSTTKLDLSDLGLTEPEVSLRGFDVSTDGASVLVALEEAPYAKRFVVALFDTQTGELIRVVRDATSTQGGPIVQLVAFSPDSTQAVVSTHAESRQWIEVLDVADASVLSTVRDATGDQRGFCDLLGMSPDNQLVQCGHAIYSVDDGTLVEQFGDRSFADSRGVWFVQSRTGVIATTFLDDEPRSPESGDEIFIREGSSEREVLVEFVHHPKSFRSTTAMSFDPSGSLLLQEEAGEKWTWSQIGARRHRSATGLTVYAAGSTDVLAEAELEWRIRAAAWSESGLYAAISDDFEVAVFDYSDL